ncbi:hypothetical protein N7535_008855 [Penicillium sp. DV-2018c]|nr:hypothetical protein N7461_002610 [Penicillium sp. DV-2018c]KAJ5563691.1 hypothetical protein N7535_008855 [Penicillium sp. DV-2018c]
MDNGWLLHLTLPILEILGGTVETKSLACQLAVELWDIVASTVRETIAQGRLDPCLRIAKVTTADTYKEDVADEAPDRPEDEVTHQKNADSG